ncbi:MAG: rhomboid family intramembrane serine protease [Chitinivibrionales bacterium]|nr:rhomboid family intramembrane serine protease [Chitinivibrionales bacterium]MBD3394781.1 rhomboid family intramembrane serine protease [Chitinivibrionales bacterium]
MLSYGSPGISRGVRDILIATIAVYVFQIFRVSGDFLVAYGALTPSRVLGGGQVWRLVTYLFLHDPRGPWHLAFNMLALWMFGVEVEQMWGTRRFVVFYIASGACSGLVSFLMWDATIIGASGAVLALLTVYAIYFPHRQVLMFFIFPVPVRVAVGIIGFISLVGSMGSGGGIAHVTHLGGIVVALVYVKGAPIVQRWLWRRRKLQTERAARAGAEQRLREERDFEERVDPILKKISEQGMASLTADELEILKRASSRGRRQ